MKLKLLALTLLSALCLSASAGNTKTTVSQVTDGVKLTTDVDYIVTNATPFTSAGSVDIVNTEHAVLILSSIKPSKVLSNWMNYIYINGEKAVNGENCQVKMYNKGAIIFPYAKDFAPLTCYTEQNFGGDPCSTYTEGHSGGFMKSLTATTLNNKIRSFKLKRGYMVTFAVGKAGWGYSRCFIADQEDLEISTLPTILDQKISSYRIFPWFNARKAGIGDSNDKNAIANMNLSWCYRMWPDPQGLNYLPDTEYVPHHYKESWPSAAELGAKDFSCHMKTNNEPGNSADEEPCSVNDILANWQGLMRTGMRLLSPSSHDGSLWHLDQFIDSIDARGWRCDILDIHCYWASGFDNNNMVNFSNNHGHGRPIWISEWIWGASWNKNGCFGSGVTDATILSQTKNILNSLNNSAIVERYAYWNSESKGKIYNGGVTELGKAYGDTDDGMGYDPSREFIPKGTRIEPIGKLTSTYNNKKGTVALEWSDPNCDIMSNIEVRCKYPESNTYTTIATVEAKDKESSGGVSYSYTATVDGPGTYVFQIREKGYDNKYYTSNETTINVDPAQGTSKIQYGKLILDNLSSASIDYSESFEDAPYTFIGTMTNKNTKLYAGNRVGLTSTKAKFSYQLIPWKTSEAKTMDKSEEIPFLALQEGNYTFGDMVCEVGNVNEGITTAEDATYTDTVEVTFKQAFPEGVTPVVLTELFRPTGVTSTVLSCRMFDVTNTGFKYIVYAEYESKYSITTAPNVRYLAITPGFDYADEEAGILIAAGHGNSQVYGSTQRESLFTIDTQDEEGNAATEQLLLASPVVLTQLQTNNFPAVTMLRRTDSTEKDEAGTTWTTGTKVKRILDHELTIIDENNKETIISTSNSTAPYRDNLGWVTISNVKEGGSLPSSSIPDAIATTPANDASALMVRVVDRRIIVDGISTFEVYSIAGTKVEAKATLEPGIYTVKANGKSAKVLVK